MHCRHHAQHTMQPAGSGTASSQPKPNWDSLARHVLPPHKTRAAPRVVSTAADAGHDTKSAGTPAKDNGWLENAACCLLTIKSLLENLCWLTFHNTHGQCTQLCLVDGVLQTSSNNLHCDAGSPAGNTAWCYMKDQWPLRGQLAATLLFAFFRKSCSACRRWSMLAISLLASSNTRLP